jgi:aminomethyltransferase
MQVRVETQISRTALEHGKATSTTWSPTLKKLIALALVSAPHTRPGTRLEMEVTSKPSATGCPRW